MVPEFSHSLASVIASSELDSRPRREPDPAAENLALLALTSELARSPKNFFQTLVNAALTLARADSTGVSLLNQPEGRFVWPAVAGKLSSYLGAGTPSDFGPCGTVLERLEPVLFQRPERHFTYLAPITPPLEEVLLIPFYTDGKAVGTLWAVLHRTHRVFDGEDRRLLENLSNFAASAYGTLARSGALDPLLRMRHGDSP